MKKYDHKKIEAKWQKYWAAKKVFQAKDFAKKPKKFVLVEFPYPSGAGLHMGHLRPYVAADVFARFHRLHGKEVLFPIGWDAFGLPAENYAIKMGVHPSITTKKNVSNAKKQMLSWGLSFDWSREINTTDPSYYKWTQWLFLQFYKAGLAYEATGLINWCPKDKTGLANEEVIDGKCERCGTVVEKKELRQWYLKITAYAEKLLQGLQTLDKWPEAVKLQQENWIGKSTGAEIEFDLDFKSKVKPKTNFVLLHGWTGSPNKHFFPWLKSELERRGFKVQVPALPNSNNPIVSQQVDYVLKNCHFDEDTVIFGHSLGGVVGMKVLEKLNRPVDGLVLAASYIENKFKDKSTFDKKAFDWKFDFTKIKSLTNYSLVVREQSDPLVFEDQADKLSVFLGVPIFVAKADKGHFWGKQEQDLLSYLIPQIKVFTTRPDTIFGATYLVLAPEHPWVVLATNDSHDVLENKAEVKRYLEAVKNRTEVERTAEGKDKTGVELKGIKAVNPATKKEIPIFVADYVLGHYGTGAIMAVPAHDQRDFEFAKKFGLPVKRVVEPKFVDSSGDSAVKLGQDFVKRNAVCAIIKNPQNNKYLVLSWKQYLMHGLVTGGVEGNENFVEAALREIQEETGYKNLKLVYDPNFALHSQFYHRQKQQNRWARFQYLFFELVNEERGAIAEEEDAHHEVLWIEKKDLKDFFTVIEGQFINNFIDNPDYIYSGDGILFDSGEFSDTDSAEALTKMATEFGKLTTQYKLRDWVFSRQRYWGEPIPIIHCQDCGIVPVPEKDLPVKLPPVKKYEPTGTGESPLAAITKWVNVKCPKCKGPAKRETNTMPQWAGSSWYWLRYTDPRDKKTFADIKKQKYWTPVDVYFGGMEHTTLHLLYSRFWNLFLHDQKLVSAKEPYTMRKPHGIVLGPDGEKMSKSRGNVVNPDDGVKTFGADTVRMYELFLGPHEAMVSWSDQGIVGVYRFLDRVWNWGNSISAKGKDSEKTERAINKLIKKVTEDIENFRFNTAVSALMEFYNAVREEAVSKETFNKFLILLYPLAPHVAEELHQILGGKKTLQLEKWPKWDEAKLVESTAEIIIQVNGKVKGKIAVGTGISQDQAKAAALKEVGVKKAVAGNEIKRVIFVPNRLINLVV